MAIILQEEDKSYVPNPHFEDDVLFVDGVHADTSFVILDSWVPILNQSGLSRIRLLTITCPS